MDTRPSTHYHSTRLRLSNWLARRLNSLGLARIDLSEQSLLDAARSETGLERFGDESFLTPLRVLLESAEEEAELNAFGRANVRGRTIRSLKNRLWANACFEAHPEILDRKIPAPLIILGPHRSGTTRLQRMLATDSRWQHLKTWEGINPAPRPGAPDHGKLVRHREVVGMIRKGREMYPGAYTAHPMDADWAEEEMLLLNHSFCGFTPLGLYNIPSYYQWFLHADKTDAYRYMADLMKLISWSRGDPEDKPWILKNPQHMLDLPVLMKTFPDARLVFSHRDPLKTVASVMSLMWNFAVQHTDRPCRAPIRDVWLDFCEKMARRCMQDREGIPAQQQLDVSYEEMNRDWRAVMQGLYHFSGMPFTAQAEQAMATWLAESETSKTQGAHRYSLEDFGITNKEVDARMMFVRERYGIAYEGK